ncbi:hypothetical protein [Streptomyces coerulescens]|uniref:Uncharacterized protein n=1 Tax=Streptomyces coerulescens TaxID=29304 RepID=A0ABW0CXI4_STRCD
MHDVLDPRDLVPDEAEQLATSGYSQALPLWQQARAAASAGDLPLLKEIEQSLASLALDATWAYEETSDLEILRGALPARTRPRLDQARTADRIRGAWRGRCIGNTLGKPVEGLSRAEVALYLRAVDQSPQTGYIPLGSPRSPPRTSR